MNNQIHYLCNPFTVQAAGGGGGILHIFDTKNQSVGTVPPNPLPDPPKASRTSLLALLTVSGEETMESFTDAHAVGSANVPTFTANGITATITPTTGVLGVIRNTVSFGRYNTSPEGTGSKYWQFNADPANSAVLTFSVPIAAFWLYMTDTGDFDATMEITMVKTGGGTDVYSPDAPAGAADGALNFWGLVDARGTTTYDAVQLRRTNTTDVIGLDGIGFATAAQIA